MTPLLKKFLGINWILAATILGLLVFGVFAVYAACAHRGPEFENVWSQQIKWICLGMAVFFGASIIDYKWVRWGAPIAYLAGLAGLLALQKFAVEIYGQSSWLRIAGFSIQPSQFAIVAGILLLAVGLSELQRVIPAFRYHFLRLLITAIAAGIPMFLVIKDDLGSGMVWAPVLASMWLVGNIPYRYLITGFLIVLCVIPIGYFFVLKEHQQKRIDTLFKLWKGEKINTRAEGWDIHNVTTAIGSAGWDGKGFLGKRVPEQRTINRMKFIPDTAINDYIFPVIAEEQGFRGSMLMISALAFLLLQCIFIAFSSRDQLGRLIAVGAVAMLFFHIFWNIGMCLLLVPIAGIPLPLISYGGTFMLCVLFLLGMTQSVWVHRNTPSTTKPPAEEPAL
jgi:rod shape determining protein RodA